ncbi:MAG: dTDP-4-amino-4,6-dideoxygalactose transaminase [Chitinophagales bacterium]
MIPFNKPFIAGRELEYIRQAVVSGKISGNGDFTNKCHRFFETRFGFKKVLLTNSCTDALEMATILLDIQPGDEVIMPSFTFVSTANAFVLRGAKIVFADSLINEPNIDVSLIESLITNKTKAIVATHYGGIAADMDKIMSLATKYNLFVVEDAAQSIGATFNRSPLGGIGHLAAFSFHETKNIISGEGGMLVINNEKFLERSEIIWEKGTNRASYFRGESDKYNWVDIGSSFLPSEITAAFLFAQTEHFDRIQEKRKNIWDSYFTYLSPGAEKNYYSLLQIPDYAQHNFHLFAIICKNIDERTSMIRYLKENGFMAVFHYQSLHSSPFYSSKHDGRQLPNCDMFSDCLLRLPFYFDLESNAIQKISESINSFYG